MLMESQCVNSLKQHIVLIAWETVEMNKLLNDIGCLRFPGTTGKSWGEWSGFKSTFLLF